MTDYSDLVKRLRGKKLNCTCAAKSANECCCDTDWPESFCNEAADAIEALYTRLAELEARFDYIEAIVEKRARSPEATETEILSIIRKERVFYDCA